ncbi:MAG: hypothetical protein IT464_02010 [Planctomycetes bacterium]|nr:hypothetical protein [Planctomycetota bacterium]
MGYAGAMGLHQKISRAVFAGTLFLLSVISYVALDRLELMWNIWAQVITGLVVLIAAWVLGRYVPRWLGVERD